MVFGGLLIAVSAGAQMPDVSQMSGVPLPMGDLPTGAVSVRVVRGDMSNNVTSQAVELHGAGPVRTENTDQNGRATFMGLTPGTRVRAVTTVDGQRLESQEFAVPSAGGVRLMLVAAAAGAASASGSATTATPAPPSPSAGATGSAEGVTLGGDSRFVIEITDDGIEVYSLLDIVNAGDSPAQIGEPLVFAVPPEAGTISLLEESSAQATADGRVVTVRGPFAVGRTPVQFAYRVAYGGSRVVIRQPLPVALPSTSLLIRKLPNVTFASPQVTSQREVPIDSNTYFVGAGPAIRAGGTLEITLNGLPHHSPMPRYTALAIALALIVAGIWLSVAGPVGGDDERRRLEARREQLFGDLVRLEEQHAAKRSAEGRYRERRAALIEQLEIVCARLDDIAPETMSSVTGESRETVGVEASLRARRA
jgi:hypothetical protein